MKLYTDKIRPYDRRYLPKIFLPLPSCRIFVWSSGEVGSLIGMPPLLRNCPCIIHTTSNKDRSERRPMLNCCSDGRNNNEEEILKNLSSFFLCSCLWVPVYPEHCTVIYRASVSHSVCSLLGNFGKMSHFLLLQDNIQSEMFRVADKNCDVPAGSTISKRMEGEILIFILINLCLDKL